MTTVVAPPEPGDWRTLAEAADDLGVSYPTAYRLYQAGHLPGWREGQVYRISAQFLRAVRATVDAGRQVTLSVFAREYRAARATPAEAAALTTEAEAVSA